MNKMIVICLEEIPVNYTGVVFHSEGVVYYFLNGKLHRKIGPAVRNIHNGVKKYYQHGKLHRKDEPAVEVEYINGKKIEFWENGEWIKTIYR
jgi:antitoxin component YwqK of YwqJK toxin-antitoxin module